MWLKFLDRFYLIAYNPIKLIRWSDDLITGEISQNEKEFYAC